MNSKLIFLILGILIGAAGTYSVFLFWSEGRARPVSETSVFTAPGLQVWYESSADGQEFVNEFRARRLCGDAQKPCSDWSLVATLRSDRAFSPKEIEFATAGEKVLMHMPSGHAIKGELSGAWTVEAPAGAASGSN